MRSRLRIQFIGPRLVVVDIRKCSKDPKVGDVRLPP